MPRTARKKSDTGIYHIILRGINKQTIFYEKEDYEKYLRCLTKYKSVSKPTFYAYCLMDNHAHLLIKEGIEPLEIYFRRVGASFVYWYNRKYERCGHLFQNRFRSEPVDDDLYFQTVYSYILHNPKKAGLCKEINDYPWSSCSEPTSKSLIDFDELKKYINPDNLNQFMGTDNENKVLDLNSKKATDSTALKIMSDMKIASVREFISSPKNKQTEIVNAMSNHGCSIRQISRITGTTRYIIEKMLNPPRGQTPMAKNFPLST